ncbi:MAG: tryptophan--tRNA ligase [Methanocalculus sp.]|uniref:tryptophan--tRNA ligase n=1 Tax=Methanocalculus sp. TaxID=2004547 RepID=UPI0027193269|nr:tryptophan--tRNA ligase [Methanocalculus sp.]MDO9539176.1 tryptophan--tRNA ligase [Methanocalculus sp.]
MESGINPWSSTPDVDIARLFTDFGIEPVEEVAGALESAPAFFRRKIIVGHRDYGGVVNAINSKTHFNVMTGFMPSGHPHLGHLMVMREVVWHVEQGGSGYVAIADREAHAVRGLSWDACKKYGREYLECLYALGFTGTTYYQSENERLKDLAFEAAIRINFSDLSAIYGFSQETSLAHADSVATQVADILYPQLMGGPAPTVVPVGIDQDPHIRLTRDIAHKMRWFTVLDSGDLISVRSKNAPSHALDAVADAFPGSRRYEGHVDIPGADCISVSEKVRALEVAEGGYGFITPSSTYHSFMQGLQGGKMSSSVSDSLFWFDEPAADVKKKVMGALTGGRMTKEEQVRLGGEPDKCPVYLLNLFHMIEDDTELLEIRSACLCGSLLCGACKKATFERVKEFLSDFKERRDAISHKVVV